MSEENKKEIDQDFSVESVSKNKQDIEIIKEKIKDIEQRGIKDAGEKELVFMTENPELYDRYTYVTKRICKGHDMGMLEEVFKYLENLNMGKDKFEEQKKLGEKIANKHFKFEK